mmetsp:Transcript_5222/g.12511  ORF Transcript_5222/g.12511 Transcript_5222/m.12511 type:complete len:207 (-) Transcript_5222:447-1067(-)
MKVSPAPTESTAFCCRMAGWWVSFEAPVSSAKEPSLPQVQTMQGPGPFAGVPRTFPKARRNRDAGCASGASVLARFIGGSSSTSNCSFMSCVCSSCRSAKLWSTTTWSQSRMSGSNSARSQNFSSSRESFPEPPCFPDSLSHACSNAIVAAGGCRHSMWHQEGVPCWGASRNARCTTSSKCLSESSGVPRRVETIVLVAVSRLTHT